MTDQEHETIKINGRTVDKNFVAPSITPTARAYPMTRQDDAPIVPSASTAHVELATGYDDRSKGFVRATLPLAAAGGLGTLTAAVALAGVPALSFAALLYLWSGFGVVWLVAYLAHIFISPDGALWLHAWTYHKLLLREQAHRHKREDLDHD